MNAIDRQLEQLEREEEAFLEMRETLIQSHGRGVAVIQGGALAGVFPTDDAAFEFAMTKFGRRASFLIRSIQTDRILDAPALVMGYMDAKLP